MIEQTRVILVHTYIYDIIHTSSCLCLHIVSSRSVVHPGLLYIENYSTFRTTVHPGLPYNTLSAYVGMNIQADSTLLAVNLAG